MGLINAFGAIALDATVAATNTLLTAIRDRLAVQVFHGELAGQMFDGTLNWQERV